MKQAPIGGAQYTLRSASDNRFRMLVESVHDYGIFIVDPNGRVYSWSSGAEKLNGFTSGEMIGQHISVPYTAADVAAGKPEHGLRQARARLI